MGSGIFLVHVFNFGLLTLRIIPGRRDRTRLHPLWSSAQSLPEPDEPADAAAVARVAGGDVARVPRLAPEADARVVGAAVAFVVAGPREATVLPLVADVEAVLVAVGLPVEAGAAPAGPLHPVEKGSLSWAVPPVAAAPDVEEVPGAVERPVRADQRRRRLAQRHHDGAELEERERERERGVRLF